MPSITDLYKGIVTEMSLANQSSPAWWYTWLASRDRFNSSLYQALSKQATQAETQEPLHQKGFSFRIRLYLRAFRHLLAEGIWFARWRFSERNSPVCKDADVLIVSQLSINSFQNQKFQDVYFGPLPGFLSDNGEKVVVCGLVQGRPEALIAARRQCKTDQTCAVTTFGTYIRFCDFFGALKKAVFNNIICINRSLPWGGTSKEFLRNDMIAAIPNIFYGLLIERAMERVLAANPRARIIHLYENNPWEHAVNRAARKSRRRTIGFLHCAVLPSHLKNYIAPEERDIRPGPDKIVCTGEAARNVFLSLGAHHPADVLSGCDLRGTLPAPPNQIHHPARPIKKVLAVLEGLPSMVGFLEFLVEIAINQPEIDFHVREHPALPIDKLLNSSDLKNAFEEHLVKSTEPDLTKAMSQSDIVMYQGTTASLSAAYMGIPILKYVSGDPLEDDPLFQSRHLKRTVKAVEDFKNACNAFSQMSPSDYEKERLAARHYIETYLKEPTRDTMRVFAPKTDREDTSADHAARGTRG